MNPFELADYAAAAAALTLGVAVGRRMRPRPPKPLRPICTCEHGYGTHEDGARCHGESLRELFSADTGTVEEYAPCPCRRYDGPDPIILGIQP